MHLASARGAARNLFLSACNQIRNFGSCFLATYSFSCRGRAKTRFDHGGSYLVAFYYLPK